MQKKIKRSTLERGKRENLHNAAQPQTGDSHLHNDLSPQMRYETS